MKTPQRIFLLGLILFLCSFSLKAQGPLNALKFDGIDDYVDLGTNNRGITNAVTVEAWVKTGSSKYHWILGKYDHGADKGYHLIIKDGKAAFAGRDGSGNYRNSGYSNTLVNNNTWHHLAGVCNNGVWSIYVDGLLEKQFASGYSATNLTTSSAMALGKDVLANDEYYNGVMDEVRVWNKALTQEDIRTSMCQKIDATSNGLVAYFKFNQSGTTTVQDESGLKLNGTFRNMSPSSAWVTSDAPIGDKSIYRYTSKWDTSLELITDIAIFSVSRADNTIKGFHLYQINGAPAQATGLPTTAGIQEYYGLFKVGEPSKKYKIWFKQYDLPCGGKLFRRNDNSDSNWIVVADTVASPVITYYSTANQGEFAAARNVAVQDNTLPIEYFSCSAQYVTLQAPESKNATYLWSTGETSSSIRTSELGTHTVTVTVDGCSTLYTMVVSNNECPIIPNVITPNGDGKNDAFIVEGVESSTLEIEIFNRWGKSIYQSVRYDNGWSAEGVPAGLYFYHLKSSRSQNTFKGWLEVIK